MPQAQADKIIEIPGVGRIAFPASMTPDQIDQAAAKLHREANPQAAPKPPKSWIRTAVDWLPTAGGTIGGLVGATAGPVGAIGGAALGGATGKAMQNALTGDESAPLASPLTEGVMQGGMQAAGAGLVRGAQWAGPALMKSALKPAFDLTKKAIVNDEMPRVIKTMLDEGVNVTQGGVTKLTKLLGATKDELDDLVVNAAMDIDPVRVVNVGRTAVKAASNQAAPSADKAAARAVIRDFIDTHVRGAQGQIRPMSVQRAHELKKGTYKAIGQRAYGEVKGAAVEAEKQLARGLKEGVEMAVPEAKAMNARIGALGEAQTATVKRVAGAQNRDPGGLGVLNPGSVLAFVLLRSPASKSMVSRALYSSAAKASGVPENIIRWSVGALLGAGDEQ